MPVDKEDEIHGIYEKATRPNPKPKQWRVNPSTAVQKKQLVDYTTDLEDAIVHQQDKLIAYTAFLRDLQKGKTMIGDISNFLTYLPGVRYRKRNKEGEFKFDDTDNIEPRDPE